MTMSANSVLTAIDVRHPGMKPAKQHLLLFFAQGHHLGHFDTPLFPGSLIATDRGAVVLDGDGGPAETFGTEGELNTVGYVVERYSALSPADLRTLVKSSGVAAGSGYVGYVDLDRLRDWFRRDDETNDPDDERPNRAERAAGNEAWKAHLSGKV